MSSQSAMIRTLSPGRCPRDEKAFFEHIGPVATGAAPMVVAANIIQLSCWVKSSDGEWLAATLFEEPNVERDAPVLIINCATGKRQTRYFDTARWWATRGWRVVTYDYRGIGETSRRRRAAKQFRLWEWGSQDMSAIVGWVHRDLTPSATVVIGHSIGAQIIQFCTGLRNIDAAVFVAGQKGYWRHWRNQYRYPICAFWHVILPACVGICGSFPLMRLAGCETLPASVALDWARWGRARPFTAEAENHGHDLDCPLLSISIADDQLYGPEEAVRALLEWYPNARSERLHLVPDAHGVARIGHGGMFDEQHLERFWPLVSAWLWGHLGKAGTGNRLRRPVKALSA